MKVLVTGAKGFVGKNLVCALKNVQEGKDRTRRDLQIEQIWEYDLDTPASVLDEACAEADFVFHLAGVNRPKDKAEFMTGNAGFTETLLQKLRDCGMKTISISLDGLPATHDAFRRTPGGWEKGMQGVQNLIKVGGFQAIQITTVVTHQNIVELDALYEIFKDIDIDSWRVINMDPIGRAKAHPELLLTKEDYRTMFEFIRNKRIAGEPVCYGCSHYLGMDYEREVRDWYFLCTAGLYTASITVNGDIIACLDIERRPEFVQGNIFEDRFKDVWENKFQIFRKDLALENEKCRECSEAKFCHGGAYHTWDFDNKYPQVCFKDVLFE
jgi:radical SAM protein with 4Fe4S-binding SPASM domain